MDFLIKKCKPDLEIQLQFEVGPLFPSKKSPVSFAVLCSPYRFTSKMHTRMGPTPLVKRMHPRSPPFHFFFFTSKMYNPKGSLRSIALVPSSAMQCTKGAKKMQSATNEGWDLRQYLHQTYLRSPAVYCPLCFVRSDKSVTVCI